MKVDMRQLEEINERIDGLKKELQKLEEEKKNLFETKEVLNRIPVNVRNALKRIGISLDYQFLDFLEGRSKVDFIYEKADTRKERLMSLRNVGRKFADATLKILEDIDF